MKIKGKLLAAAIALLGLSTAGSVAGTVAWFTASNSVSISGMNIQAETEQGIVISNEAKSTWKTSAVASHNGEIPNPAYGEEGQPEKIQARFVPTSTSTGTDWFHGYAANVDDAREGEVVESVSATQLSSETGVYKFTENAIDKNIYLLNKFYIKSSGNSAIASQDIYVKSIKAVLLNGGTAATQKLSTALRVLIKATAFGGKSIVFAPISAGGATPTLTYPVGALAAGVTPDPRSTITAIASIAANDTSNELTAAAGITIPAYSSESPLEFEVYAYFEGEDAACKSTNIPAAELEKLAVSFELANKNHDA